MHSLSTYLSTHPKKHLIFDFDGTIARLLIDWSKWHAGIEEIYRRFEPEFEPEHWRMDYVLNAFIEKYGAEIREQLWQFNETFEQEYLTGVQLNGEVIDWIKKQHQEYTLYLLTSNSRKTIEPILKELNIYEVFDQLIFRDDVEYIKPHGSPFTLIPGHQEAHKSEWLMIGDSSSDQGFAEANGMDFFRVEF